MKKKFYMQYINKDIKQAPLKMPEFQFANNHDLHTCINQGNYSLLYFELDQYNLKGHCM